MKSVTIYHGSDHIIECPVYHGGKLYNDYGYGFYCTEHKDAAKEWSVEKDRDGFCNAYAIDTEGLRILNLNGGEYTILHWLSVLLENRRFEVASPLAREGKAYLLEHFFVDYQDADVIKGYRADDSYFSFASDFINGTISVRQLEEAMHLGQLGEQFVVISEHAFSKISFAGYEIVKAEEWFGQKEMRDATARKKYRKMDKDGYVRGELYMPMLIDGEVRADDPRLRRIVS